MEEARPAIAARDPGKESVGVDSTIAEKALEQAVAERFRLDRLLARDDGFAAEPLVALDLRPDGDDHGAKRPLLGREGTEPRRHFQDRGHRAPTAITGPRPR